MLSKIFHRRLLSVLLLPSCSRAAKCDVRSLLYSAIPFLVSTFSDRNVTVPSQ